MALLVWQNEYNIGIDVIDRQHMRIGVLINRLHLAQQKNLERSGVAMVIDELVDYTLSHFAFEEELLEESGYPFTQAHKRVHEIFVRRVNEYRMRFQAGEDVAEELRGLLSRWLINHIRGEDRSYVDCVKRHVGRLERVQEQAHASANTQEHGSWLSRKLKHWFGDD